MESTARIRSTRDRPAKPPLSETAIVEAALAITQAEGLDAVTMRRVASELDTGAASLYVYVRNREELLRAMFDRVAETVPLLVPNPARWREQAYDMLLALRRALEAHPGLAAALWGEPPVSEAGMAGLENLLGILLAGGIEAQDAAWACDILFLIVTATATEADVRRAAGQTTDGELDAMVSRMREFFSGLPPERYPHVVAHTSQLLTGDVDDRFSFAVETFLDGLGVRSARA